MVAIIFTTFLAVWKKLNIWSEDKFGKSRSRENLNMAI
jgi:hypothetical protein